jgi:hypothetical protein
MELSDLEQQMTVYIKILIYQAGNKARGALGIYIDTSQESTKQTKDYHYHDHQRIFPVPGYVLNPAFVR